MLSQHPVLYFVQRSATTLAIGSHRTRRKNDMARNPLDEVAGIGDPQARLSISGTAKAVSWASMEDLVAAGYPAQMAKLIYDHFHENGG